jgi:hypothetical protein
MIEHELRRKVLPRPLEKEGECGVAMRKRRGVRECPIKRVEFAEVGQMCERRSRVRWSGCWTANDRLAY